MNGLREDISFYYFTLVKTELPIRRPWTEDETVLALFLYFQTPFGKIDQRNPEIQRLADMIRRTSSSVAMKLANFASLDPKITGSGKRGLAGASKLDRELYARFAQNWDKLVIVAADKWASGLHEAEDSLDEGRLNDMRARFDFRPYTGFSFAETTVQQRRGQDFFRRAVLANYAESCCVTGIAEPKLLVASHILPWGENVENRYNPANGLLLSATVDKAFDQGLLTIERTGIIRVAKRLTSHPSIPTREFFQAFDDVRVRPAVRFDPDPAFLDWHNENRFVDQLAA